MTQAERHFCLLALLTTLEPLDETFPEIDEDLASLDDVTI